jgi:hypothetical protein
MNEGSVIQPPAFSGRSWFVPGACVLLALIFALAAIPKILDPFAFSEAIDNYRLTPHFLSASLALYLPWFELTLAVALLFRSYRAAALALSSGLLAVFSLSVLSALVRGLDISCGCFGTQEADGPLWTSLVRSLALAAAAGWLLWAERRKPPRA